MIDAQERKYLKILFHILIWLLLFTYPLASLNEEYLIHRNWVSLTCIFIAFYINYFVLVDLFFFRNKKPVFYILNILLIILLYVLLRHTLKSSLFHPTVDGKIVRQVRNGAMTTIQLILPIILSIGMCLGLKVNTRFRKSQLLLEQIKQTQLNSEIKYLKYQVQPHFLFNTLNNIYALVDSAPEIAKESIHTMSKMMRYLLHEASNSKVSLTKEIEFIERYIELMQLRVSSNVTLKKNFPIINQPIQIAPLLLISFVENAFKHGIDAVKPSFINVELSIDREYINYKVINSSFPEKEKVTDSGIGLENLKKRLELVYPKKFELKVKEEANLFIAELKLKFKE